MTRLVSILAAALVLLAPAGLAQAQPDKAELQARFKARDADLREQKRQGRIGETIDGFVDVVSEPDRDYPRIADLVTGENEDRRVLYQILADEINRELPADKARASPATVAKRNALRNIERAGPQEWLRVAKGHWIRVKEFPRYEKLTKLKTQGKVGETTEGLVEVVTLDARSDPEVVAVVKEENDARTAEYRDLAAKENVQARVIAERTARRNFENARIGDMLKDKGGAWRKK